MDKKTESTNVTVKVEKATRMPTIVYERCMRCKRILPDGDSGVCIRCEDRDNGIEEV